MSKTQMFDRRATVMLQKVTRCPIENCNGEIHQSLTSDSPLGSSAMGDSVEGYSQAVFRCLKCNIRFVVTNPRSING